MFETQILQVEQRKSTQTFRGWRPLSALAFFAYVKGYYAIDTTVEIWVERVHGGQLKGTSTVRERWCQVGFQ